MLLAKNLITTVSLKLLKPCTEHHIGLCMPLRALRRFRATSELSTVILEVNDFHGHLLLFKMLIYKQIVISRKQYKMETSLLYRLDL